MSLPMWDPRKILEVPSVYNFFQKIVGAQEGRIQFVRNTIAPLVNGRVLEVGCGPGINCEGFPESVKYIGCDINEKYITFAKQRYGSRAEFYAKPVGHLGELGLEPFDAVILLAVLHHLSDEEVLTLCEEAANLLNPGGLFITADPCFSNEQSAIERFITSCDRGRFVRFPEQYKALLEKRFPQVKMEINKGKLLVIPCTGVVMIAALN